MLAYLLSYITAKSKGQRGHPSGTRSYADSLCLSNTDCRTENAIIYSLHFQDIKDESTRRWY